ncbi:hypothetical protein BZA05DRAFT_83217 [Tricharina praecox]|uniref:uncharacterized protein n=1 Tax=Tricharina praecox TaxID=43433 RepID=UPI002220865E|nr:uncharacterized protein BZA05DRAFT_83217 [Tricharina praecox]KAI5849119.1 hypothetical protein BZA05DRAFT_83217 [Tricharina praecox]
MERIEPDQNKGSTHQLLSIHLHIWKLRLHTQQRTHSTPHNSQLAPTASWLPRRHKNRTLESLTPALLPRPSLPPPQTMIRHARVPSMAASTHTRTSTNTSTRVSSPTTAASPSPPSTFTHLLSQLTHTIFILLAFANTIRLLLGAGVRNSLCCLQQLSKRAGIHRRWNRFKDACFYELLLLLFQPSPVLLILMWPGWVLVVGLWLWGWAWW